MIKRIGRTRYHDINSAENRLEIHSRFKQLDIALPRYEIDDNVLEGSDFTYAGNINTRVLRNGGTEEKLLYRSQTFHGIELVLYIQYNNDSPFIRFKYVLNSDKPVKLTKAQNEDNIQYADFNINSSQASLTEIQFGKFDSLFHSYVPYQDKKDDSGLKTGIKLPGPCVVAQLDGSSMLVAYEHGAEYPDSYLSLDCKYDEGSMKISINALKGNYSGGQLVDSRNPFISPWFHFSVIDGDSDLLLRHYRNFFLKYICESGESRKPYIYYNTWNYQERNNYFNQKKYLDSMRLERIWEEIDVAHKLGIDVFVIDAGWFSKTGDWEVDREKFPDGLKQVKLKLDRYNMKLGLWLDPTKAAKTSEIYIKNPEYAMTQDGKSTCRPIWETEESYGMCLASDYSQYIIDKMIQLNKTLGVTYFKWDGISQYGCNSPLHNHGNEDNLPGERAECYSFRSGMEMVRIVEEVTKQCPDVIVDFDVTEEHRFFGLGFLSVGKYFLVNNGPYAVDFDIPEQFTYLQKEPIKINPMTNIFFYPGPSRSRICRKNVIFDGIVPSILFMAHFLPDKTILSQKNSLSSLMLGGNGIWGDLLNLEDDDIGLFRSTLEKYKLLGKNITQSYPFIEGFIGSSPEIYEKIDYSEEKGIIVFFTKSKGSYSYITKNTFRNNSLTVEGSDYFEQLPDNRLKVEVKLGENDSRTVFIY